MFKIGEITVTAVKRSLDSSATITTGYGLDFSKFKSRQG
jgi:hypothetical protein